jgi:hypothetical protein
VVSILKVVEGSKLGKRMKARYPFLLFLFLAGTAFSGEPAGRIVDLQPELQQALVRDDLCVKNTDQVNGGQELQSPVLTEQIFSAGREAGVIAAPQDDCHCRNGNCSTFVYLKSGGAYKLALESKFSSLHPMKVIKHGLPSLSGKFQVSPVQEETTIFDWSGTGYQPSLCATVTQNKNRRLPAISRHPCSDR